MTDPRTPHGPSLDPGRSPPASDPALRRKADAVYRAHTAGLPDPFEASWPEPARALVHELRVHQIELEMQNEELRRLQVELAATRARYFDLFDLAPVGYLLVRENGLILQANLTAAAMLGEVRGALTDRPVSRSIFQADQDAFYLCRRRLADTGKPQSCELRVVKPGGAHLWVLVAMTAACADDGTPLHRVTLTDIGESKRADTDRRTLEDQLRQAQKMEAIGRLAGGVAHDFNNLLTVINCHSEIALSETEPGDPLREPMAAIRDAGERAANLTQQLLAFSRRAIVALRVLDLNDVVASITKMLRRLISEDIAFATVLCPTPCRVRIDPGQIEQVIMNLGVNARDAMPKGGRLTIETNYLEVFRATPDCPPGRYVRLTVTDTGTGMTEDEKAQIFEPFFTTKEVGMGTGLGLATVYGIVKQAGGHIRVESTISKGTTFEVMFPEAESSVTDRPSDSIRFAPRGSETILLAEDEDAVRKVTRLGLEMQGYTVIETGTVAEAIATAASYPGLIQLLVTDVIMPELGGRELADAIRANRPDIRVLYVSGYTSDALVRHGVEQGVDSFLQKPFTPLTLARKVRMVLDAPAPGVIS